MQIGILWFVAWVDVTGAGWQADPRCAYGANLSSGKMPNDWGFSSQIDGAPTGVLRHYDSE